jgi:hypothetical protein
MRDLPQPFSYVFRQTTLKDDGSVDGGRVLANLSGLEEGDKLRLLSDSLSELIYMECIAARRELGATDSADLIKRVQDLMSITLQMPAAGWSSYKARSVFLKSASSSLPSAAPRWLTWCKIVVPMCFSI